MTQNGFDRDAMALQQFRRPARPLSPLFPGGAAQPQAVPHHAESKETDPGIDDMTVIAFSWGHVLERRVNQLVVWDFCLTGLLTCYLQRGRCLADLQRLVFEKIETEVDCTSRDSAMAAGLDRGWILYPGSAMGAITQIVHFTAESEAREWTADVLIDTVLPQAMAHAQNYIAHPDA